MPDSDTPVSDPHDETLPPSHANARGPAVSGLPARLGTYRVDGLLGQGGMGEVLRGFDERLRRPVALKRIARDHPDARARFWREARALAALSHPGVVRIFEIGEAEGGALFLAMELVEGRPLSDFLNRPWPAAAAVEVVRQAAAALGAAHAAGLVHRDVKPANLLLTADGTVRVVDFGLARQTDGDEDRVTETGAILGTPAYMAPEQLAGSDVSPATDVFALGILLYRLLSGVHPFARESSAATSLALAAAQHVPLGQRCPDVAAPLVEAVERCLAARPEGRFPEGAALAVALDRALPAAREVLAGFLTAPTPAPESGSDLPRGSLPLATPAAPSASKPASLRVTAWLLAVLGVAAVAVVVTRPSAPGPSAITAPSSPLPEGPSLAAPVLPPRPVVAVLGFEAPTDDPDDPRAAVLADALRLALDTNPEKLAAVPLGVLEGTLPPAREPGPTTELRLLQRPHRGPGHIDFAVTGRLDETSVELRLLDVDKGTTLRQFQVQGSDDPIALAWQVAPAVASLLGAELPAGHEPPTRSSSAWGALLQARRALRAGQFEAHARSLEWALRLDPRFTLARLDDLARRRANRDEAGVREGSAALARDLEGSGQAEHLVETAAAWAALGRGEPAEALRRLLRVVERFPYDVEAWQLLLVLRAHTPELRSFAEVERVARSLLAVAPRSEEAASRLVRALSWRGRVAEADAALAGLGIPADDSAFLEVFAEQDLYAGRYGQALERFRTVLARSPDDLYAEHMGFAARLLSGDCAGAAVAALERIDRIEATGRDANLDWTYSLAVQSLFCAERWDEARSLFGRWESHSASGREQVAALRPRVDLAAGVAPARVEKALLAALAKKGQPAAVRAPLMALLARIGRDLPAVRRLAEEARGKALDTASTPGQRAGWLRAHEALSLRARVLEGDLAGALAEYTRRIPPWSELRDEGELGARVEAQVLAALALEEAGRAADAADLWNEIVSLGYPRLWVNDLYALARRKVAK